MGRNKNQVEYAEPTESVADIKGRLARKGIPVDCNPSITNFVVSFETWNEILNEEPSLEMSVIGQNFRHAIYNPRRFAGVVIRMRSPVKATALLFRNGHIMIVGTLNVEDAKLAARKVVRNLTKVGYPGCIIKSHKIVNVVGKFQVHTPIRLEGFISKHGHDGACSWEPEIFPALYYEHYGRPGFPVRVKLLIFASGKIVLLGGKWPQHIWWAFEDVYNMIMEFKVSSEKAKT